MDLHSKQLWRKPAFMGVFLALAMICSYIEMLIPFDFGIPGVKLGLTNIVVVLMLYSIGTKEAFCVSVIRIFLVGILFGNLIGILYSLGQGDDRERQRSFYIKEGRCLEGVLRRPHGYHDPI